MKAGRPRGHDSRRRTRELLAHLAAGRSLEESVALARMSPRRLVRLLDDDDFWAVVGALRGGGEAPGARCAA